MVNCRCWNFLTSFWELLRTNLWELNFSGTKWKVKYLNFSMGVNLKLQPFIAVFAVFLFTCLEKACLLLSRAKRGTTNGQAFSRCVNKKNSNWQC